MAVISKDDDYDVNWVRFGSAPLIVTLVLPLVIGVILLLKCIFNHCCVRKTETKEEMFGVEGRMTILPNADAAFVTLTSPSPPPQTLAQQPLPGTLVTTTTTTSPVVTLKQQSQNLPLLVSNSNSKHPPHERSDSQQSHRSSTKSSNAHSTTIVIPKLSPASVSSSGTNGHSIANTYPATSSSTDSQQAKDSYSKETVVDLTDSLKRSTLHRQLPDLPQLPQNLQVHHNPPRRSSSVLSHDGTSELYATVGEVPNLNNHPGEVDGSHFYNPATARQAGTAPVPPAIASSSRSGRSAQPGNSGATGIAKAINLRNSTKNEPTPSSDSETYTVNHPYAKLKRNIADHPYARVRTESVGGDETDTDNYDTPQPYAQTGRNNPNSLALKPSTSQNVTDGSGQSSSGTVPVVGNSVGPGAGPASLADMEENGQAGNHPIPPRRTRQWRRNSLPQAQDNPQQQHFSGDSQDSRGYTSISVREPLSSIIANRNQVTSTRNYDSHYATVSDDSEEMYAAIEDSDGNYMRIPGEDGEPGSRSWRGGPMVASPIPERREANSPLPPPPVPPLASPPEISSPPVLPSSSSPMDQIQNPLVSNVNSNPPLYAQVAKKNKKKKAPVTPTSSNPITTNSSSSQLNNTNICSGSANVFTSTSMIPNDVKLSTNPGSSSPSASITSSSHNQATSAAKSRHTTSENTASNSSAATLLSPVDPPGSEPRRWSKADISYSEFEVVREPLYNTNISALGSSASGSGHGHSRKKSPERSSHHSHHSHSHHTKQPLEHRVSSEKEKSVAKKSHKVAQSQLLDEDNYNVIPDIALTASGRISRNSRDGSGGSGSNSVSKSSRKISTSSYNYQEIEEVSDSFHISNAYQEIERKEPSDYYQEIGTKLSRSDENGVNNNSNNLYQEIDKKTTTREASRSSVHIEDEDDEDLEDEFYETVKPAGASSSSKGVSGYSNSNFLSPTITSPSHSQGSMSSLDRKHGYEKLKKKGAGPTVVVTDILTDYDDDEDEDEGKNEDAMYERVKYPPYERLKESRDDLRDISAEDDDANENDPNLYEDIGYSRVKPKSRKVDSQTEASTSYDQLPTATSRHGQDRFANTHDGGVTSMSSDKQEKSHTKQRKNSSLKDNRVEDDGEEVEVSNLDQLYARVDKSKKKKHVNHTTTTTPPSSVYNNANPSNVSAIGLSTVDTAGNNGNTNNSNSNEPRVSAVSVDGSGESPPAFILLRTGREDNSIEYI